MEFQRGVPATLGPQPKQQPPAATELPTISHSGQSACTAGNQFYMSILWDPCSLHLLPKDRERPRKTVLQPVLHTALNCSRPGKTNLHAVLQPSHPQKNVLYPVLQPFSTAIPPAKKRERRSTTRSTDVPPAKKRERPFYGPFYSPFYTP